MNAKLNKLQKKHPSLSYEGYQTRVILENEISNGKQIFVPKLKNNHWLQITFKFTLDPKISLKSKLIFPSKIFNSQNKENNLQNEINEINKFSNLINNIALAESISYWKSACPPKLNLTPNNLSLNKQQKQFWRKLYQKGLGEFFHTNHIPPPPSPTRNNRKRRLP